MMYQALIRFENYQPAFLQIACKGTLRGRREAGPKPRKTRRCRPSCRRCRKSNCNVSAFFHDRSSRSAQRLEQFLEGTWTGSKRIQGIQGGARA